MATQGIDESIKKKLYSHIDEWLEKKGGAYKDGSWVVKAAHTGNVMTEVNNFLRGEDITNPQDMERYQNIFRSERCGDNQISG